MNWRQPVIPPAIENPIVHIAGGVVETHVCRLRGFAGVDVDPGLLEHLLVATHDGQQPVDLPIGIRPPAPGGEVHVEHVDRFETRLPEHGWLLVNH